jgi:hypothetical protein
MFSKMHPEFDPLGSDLRKQIIQPPYERIVRPWSSFDCRVPPLLIVCWCGVGDKDLVFLVDVIVGSRVTRHGSSLEERSLASELLAVQRYLRRRFDITLVWVGALDQSWTSNVCCG